MRIILKILYVFVAVSCILLNMAAFCAAEHNRSASNVLLLNSYHHGMAWTDDQTDGIVSTLRELKPDVAVFIEYLDWKNNPNEKNLEILVDLYRIKYGNRPISLIMTTDDAALEFALRHREAVFSNAPIVFSGVEHQAASRLMLGHTNVTGVYEEIDAENTIKAMLNFNPKLEQIYLIHDNTESGLVARVPVEQAASRLKPGLRVVGLNVLDHHAIINQLQQGDPQCCAALLTSYSRDINGSVLELERFARLFGEASKIPVYTTYDFLVGHGIVGGSVLSGKLTGQRAALLGLRILNGEPVPEMPEMPVDTEMYIFDYQQLMRYDLPLRAIPYGSRVLNNPKSFYDEHMQAVWGIITLFILMVIYMAALIENVNWRKAAEERLKRSNEELTALNEEMLASQEELHAQYQQLAATQDALMQSEERYKLSLEGANDGLWDWDIVRDEMYLSQRCAELLGVTDTIIRNFNTWILNAVHPEDVQNVYLAINDHLTGVTPHFVCEHRLRASSDQYWVMVRGKALLSSEGQPVRMAGSLTDITSRKQQEAAVHFMAFHDALTGLPNRAALNERLKQLLVSDSQYSDGAIILFDLDNFKIINDTFGHSYGDKLLVRVSELLRQVGGGHFIARMGGDEFVILLEEETDRSAITAWFDKLRAKLDQPVPLDDKIFHVTISAGIALFPRDGRNPDQLIKNADMALYKAKEQGKNRFAFFDPSMDEEVRQKTAMELELRDALTNKELELWYQPIMDTQTGRIIGFEALLRWIGKSSGLVMPMSFIDLAEETGLIVPIGYWVIEEACRFLHMLYREGYYDLTVTVNISVVQLLQSDFAERVQNILITEGVSSHNLGLELTESVLMESMETHIRKLRRLHKTGLKIYLDDFGTGYSSLKYLKFLPIDVVKVDKSFIDGVAAGEASDLTESIISLIHRLGLKAVAEGVEQQSQLLKLREFDCDAVQGYLFSKPVRRDETKALLAKYGSYFS